MYVRTLFLALLALGVHGQEDSMINDESVTFNLYTRDNYKSPQSLSFDANDLSQLDPKKKTVVLIHGFYNAINDDINQLVKNETLHHHDYNIICVDWGKISKNLNYLWVVGEVKGVGERVGKYVSTLIDLGVSPQDVHIIGHSLGAHVAGFAGKYLRRHSRKIARITGLDPAYPGFTNVNDYTARLDEGDAAFVDCIHTCAGELGYPNAICHADFYPNGGTCIFQPGCAFYDKKCGHGRAIEYYVESMKKTHKFEAETCRSLFFGIGFDCKNKGALMGYPAKPEFKGQFYLKTRAEYPYANHIEEEDDQWFEE